MYVAKKHALTHGVALCMATGHQTRMVFAASFEPFQVPFEAAGYGTAMKIAV